MKFFDRFLRMIFYEKSLTQKMEIVYHINKTYFSVFKNAITFKFDKKKYLKMYLLIGNTESEQKRERKKSRIFLRTYQQQCVCVSEGVCVCMCVCECGKCESACSSVRPL
jgi:hypothetical protein